MDPAIVFLGLSCGIIYLTYHITKEESEK